MVSLTNQLDQVSKLDATQFTPPQPDEPEPRGQLGQRAATSQAFPPLLLPS
jgi:hypothetical protein